MADPTVGWDANSESDLASYNLYRGTASGVYDSHDTITAPTTTATITGLVEGNRYYFVVTAVDTSDNESTASNEITTMRPKFSPCIFVSWFLCLLLAFPATVSAFTGVYQGITQDQVGQRTSNPDGRRDYQLAVSNLAGTVTNISVTNACTGERWVSPLTGSFWLATLKGSDIWLSVAGGGCDSRFTVTLTYQGGTTETATVTATPQLPPPKVGGLQLSIVSVPDPIVLLWNPVVASDLAGYRLYARFPTGPYALVADNIQTTSGTISNMEPNKTYFFVVRAFDLSNNESGNSNEVTHTTSP